MITGLEAFSDEKVEQSLIAAVRVEGRSTASVIRCLIEFGERRGLHRRRAYPSIFDYCTKGLGYSEDAAYKRLRVAKVATKHPQVLDLLESGRTDLSRLVVVAPHLDNVPADELLSKACSMKKGDLEFLVAGFAPKAVPRDTVRLLPAASMPNLMPSDSPTAQGQHSDPTHLPTVAAPWPLPAPNRVEPLTQELARISVTVDRETLNEYDRACGLMRVRRADGGRVIAKAIKALLREIDPEVRIATKRRLPVRPSDPGARRVPQHVRDLVWKRDGGRCTFTDEAGQRCDAMTGLQYDHIRPWSVGGRSGDPDNVRLLCPLHNQAEARRWFGESHVDRAIAVKRCPQVSVEGSSA